MSSVIDPADTRAAIEGVYDGYAERPGLEGLLPKRGPAGRAKPPVVVLGRGAVPPAFVVLGEAPGLNEQRQGKPFVGLAGQFMARRMEMAGIDIESAWLTNAVKIRPADNRTPYQEEIDASVPFLWAELEFLRQQATAHRSGFPIILCAGKIAACALLGRMRSIGMLVGQQQVISQPGAEHILNQWRVLFTYHPSGALRDSMMKEQFTNDLATLASII